jgi:hypothetical protein
MFCQSHNRKFNYTCLICEIELSYVSKSNLLKFFNAGFNQKSIRLFNIEEVAAYTRGKRCRKQFNGLKDCLPTILELSENP